MKLSSVRKVVRRKPFCSYCADGLVDMQAYDDYNSGKLPPYEYPKEKVDESMRKLKKLYPWLEC